MSFDFLYDEPSIPVQSGEDLAAYFVWWMKGTIPEAAEDASTFMETLDIEALRTLASQEMGSECTRVYPILSGGYNLVYFLGFLDGREAIARMNKETQTNDQTLLRDRLVSEAATLRYVRKYLSIPVPNIYMVNDQFPNSVGARFIIEERIMGRQLPLRCCTPAQRRIILTKIFQCEAEFIRARFTAIGSIYHRSEDNTFYVGPMGPTVRRSLNHTVDRGPWTSTRDWLKAYVKSELAGIQEDPEEYRSVRNLQELDNGNPPFEYHVAWLETLLAVIDKLQFLDTIPAAVERPVLHHPDMCGGNILVSFADPTDLAALIDFEGASVIPLWSAMDVPACSQMKDEEETESMQNLRFEILCAADPACAQVEFYREPLRTLRWLVWAGITSWCSIDKLHGMYQDMKDTWPVQEPAFSALDELIALGPAGYVATGRA